MLKFDKQKVKGTAVSFLYTRQELLVIFLFVGHALICCCQTNNSCCLPHVRLPSYFQVIIMRGINFNKFPKIIIPEKRSGSVSCFIGKIACFFTDETYCL